MTVTAVTDLAARIAVPYKGLAPYAEDDAPFFFGRERETGVVIGNLLASRLTLLYGQSGVGKSSLLRAGVLPQFAEQGDVATAYFASWLDPPVPALAAALADAVGLPQRLPGMTVVEAAEDCARAFGGDVLLILDQFEEYFVYHPHDEEFALQLAALVRRDDLPVSVLISIREDALARLDRFKGLIPQLFDNYLRIRHLDRESGRDAILGPLAEYARRVPPEAAVGIEPELVDEILDQVETGRVTIGEAGAGASGDGGGRIETPYLQLVLTRLWRAEKRAGSRTLRRETLRGLGGSERIVRTHLDDALGRLPRTQQAAAARIFRFLVTPSGTKVAYRAADLADYAELPRDEVERVLEVLAAQERRIVRPVGDGACEIYHDVLAAAILDWRARHLRRVASERRRRRRLLAAAALVVLAAAGVGIGIGVYRQQVDKTNDAQQSAYVAEARALPGFAGLIQPNAGPLAGAAFAGQGQQIVTAAAGGSFGVWQRGVGKTYTAAPLAGVRARGPGEVVVTAARSGAVVWTVATGTRHAIRTGSAADAAISPDNTLVAVAGRDGVVRIVDWQTRRLVGRVDSRGDSAVTSVDFTPDGRRIVFGTADGRVLAAPARGSGAAAVVVRDAGGRLASVRVGADGRSVLYVGAGGAFVLPAGHGRQVIELAKGRRPFTAASFSDDGRLIATADADGVTRVWDWRAHAVIEIFEPPGPVVSAVLSPSGRFVLTASRDGTARRFELVRPDLAVRIDGTTLSREGSEVAVRVTVANAGGGWSPPTRLTVAFAGVVRTRDVPALAGGGAPATWSVRLPVPPGTPQSSTVVASVNSGRAAVESSYANDVVTAGPVLALPNLVIDTRGIRRVAGGVAVLTRVENAGSARSKAVPLVATAPGYAAASTVLPPLAPGASTERELTLRPRPGGPGRVTVSADPRHLHPDSNYTTNTDYATIP